MFCTSEFASEISALGDMVRSSLTALAGIIPSLAGIMWGVGARSNRDEISPPSRVGKRANPEELAVGPAGTQRKGSLFKSARI